MQRFAALITAATTLLSGRLAVADSSYLGYKKNKSKYRNAAKLLDTAIANGNIEWLEEILIEL